MLFEVLHKDVGTPDPPKFKPVESGEGTTCEVAENESFGPFKVVSGRRIEGLVSDRGVEVHVAKQATSASGQAVRPQLLQAGTKTVVTDDNLVIIDFPNGKLILRPIGATNAAVSDPEIKKIPAAEEDLPIEIR